MSEMYYRLEIENFVQFLQIASVAIWAPFDDDDRVIVGAPTISKSQKFGELTIMSDCNDTVSVARTNQAPLVLRDCSLPVESQDNYFILHQDSEVKSIRFTHDRESNLWQTDIPSSRIQIPEMFSVFAKNLVDAGEKRVLAELTKQAGEFQIGTAEPSYSR